jgi:hypothetical protein
MLNIISIDPSTWMTESIGYERAAGRSTRHNRVAWRR